MAGGDFDMAYALGANGFFTKTISFVGLVETVKEKTGLLERSGNFCLMESSPLHSHRLFFNSTSFEYRAITSKSGNNFNNARSFGCP